ncbi:50S ribosomal protein L11 methyltransferase [bacterium]|nr:50S ribosomal protein L11 methyltransferase [bacterium]
MNQWYQIALPKDCSMDKFYAIDGFLGSYEQPNAVILYFEKRDDVLQALSDFDVSVISDEDWEEKWREYFVPVKIGSLTVVPPWKKNEGNIIINPARGFGTGHHETTQLSLDFIEKALKLDSSVSTMLDVGTGSGILSIAAAHIAPHLKITAIDNDPDAIENAAENLELNGVSDKIELTVEPIFKQTEKRDIVVANIISSVLYFLSDDLKRLSAKWLVLSGVLATEMPYFADRMELGDFELIDKAVKNEWSAYLFRRK